MSIGEVLVEFLRTEALRRVLSAEPWSPYPPPRDGELVPDRPDKLQIVVDDPETRAVWETAKRAKKEVASWPAWKRGEGEP